MPLREAPPSSGSLRVLLGTSRGGRALPQRPDEGSGAAGGVSVLHFLQLLTRSPLVTQSPHLENGLMTAPTSLDSCERHTRQAVWAHRAGMSAVWPLPLNEGTSYIRHLHLLKHDSPSVPPRGRLYRGSCHLFPADTGTCNLLGSIFSPCGITLFCWVICFSHWET